MVTLGGKASLESGPVAFSGNMLKKANLPTAKVTGNATSLFHSETVNPPSTVKSFT